MSNRTYQSGATKRKKASKAKEDLSKFLILTSFLLVQRSNPENNNESASLQNEIPVNQLELIPEQELKKEPEHRPGHGPEQQPEPEWEPESN